MFFLACSPSNNIVSFFGPLLKKFADPETMSSTRQHVHDGTASTLETRARQRLNGYAVLRCSRTRSNGIDIEVSRHHTVSVSGLSKYRLTNGRTDKFIFHVIPEYRGYSMHLIFDIATSIIFIRI